MTYELRSTHGMLSNAETDVFYDFKQEHKCKTCGWNVDIVVEDYYYQPGHTNVAYYDNEDFKHIHCMRQKQ